MRCLKCGSGSSSIDELWIEHVAVDLDGSIHGTAIAPVSCERCGTTEIKLSLDVDVNVPEPHRGADHDLEIAPSASGETTNTAGFPAIVCCSCGGLRIDCFVTITLAA